ncbi:MAG: ExeA family protein [Maioricimonas sp. JB049]
MDSMNATGRAYRFAAAPLPHRLAFGFTEPAESLEDVSVQQYPTQDVMTFFGFSARPFQTGPHSDQVSSVGPLGENRQSLLQALCEGTAVAVVTGPDGTGKSTLCSRVAHSDELPLESVILGSGRFDAPLAILQAVLFELDEPYEGLGIQELRLRLLKRARQLRPAQDGLLVIVDEAELLPPDVLEELRSWTAHSDEGHAPVRLVLCGSIEFDERLASHELQGFNQRIGCLITTETLTFDESAQFVTGQFEAVGTSPELILDEDAFELICRASDGNLKGLCTLADQVLRDAASAGEKPVSVETVVSALRQLRDLSVHWNLPAQLAESAGDAESTADDVQPQDSVAATPVDVPSWNDSDDDVAVLEIGPGDGPIAAPADNPHGRSDEQHPMDSTSTASVVEFSVDDPYAALDQQYGTWGEVVPCKPEIPPPVTADVDSRQPENPESVDTPEPSAGQTADETAAATTDCEQHDDGGTNCDVEAEARIQADLEALSQQIHEALRNTGRSRKRSDLVAPDWYGDDVEYDVIQPDDGSGDTFRQETEPAASAVPTGHDSGSDSEPEPQGVPCGDDVVPLAESGPARTTADAERSCEASDMHEREGDRHGPDEFDESESPRSRYALLFSRLRRRRADVVRRFSDA